MGAIFGARIQRVSKFRRALSRIKDIRFPIMSMEYFADETEPRKF